MEKFLNDYVQMMAEAQEIELDESTLQSIVNNLMESEVIWDVLDEHINNEFDNMEVRQKWKKENVQNVEIII